MATTTREEKGAGLARGPALILGTVLLVAGLYFLYKQHTFPKLSEFPSGDAKPGGKVFLGIFGVNGWSGELTAAAGGLLLFGSAQHLLAKTMSLIVGVALAVVAVLALVDGDNALGLFAANIWTVIGWGGAAALLLVNTLLPRRTKTIEEEDRGRSETIRETRRPVVEERRPVSDTADREVVSPRTAGTTETTTGTTGTTRGGSVDPR